MPDIALKDQAEDDLKIAKNVVVSNFVNCNFSKTGGTLKVDAPASSVITELFLIAK
jgi:hypothetical protein